ncbi:gamma-glutamyl-gamma-aminobutyraldehyde dehydrogenase [Oceanisphaera marina]|uniref:Gamma-glutamyl-gamma-aminobutyraldehyde dehydrogenase n=1 Tax=Oceanisphaera marina TaxID=2017550 RepID=A0ABQ1IB30_9GAMM|nr:aldehyde dehydrogenase [Oceanisphaera marina]GGB32811.1 gamma-glutamyl-gamma-aminobutyraldehyde dehydrogenase [Oceanisphaera marina]
MDYKDKAYWQALASELTLETRLFIAGKYQKAQAGECFGCINPATDHPLAEVSRAQEADVNKAVMAARSSFESGVWSEASPAERKSVLLRLAALIEKHQQELALLETLNTGKPIRHSLRDDIPGAVRAIRWYAESIDKIYGEIAPTANNALALISREPVGVVAAIVPWNFPLLLACWKLGPALAAGNSVVLKPSEKAPLSAIRLGALAKKAGLPDGVLNILPGLGLETGKALGLHHDVDCLTFTGSTGVGRRLLEYAGSSNMKRVWIEAGGKSANIVFADCPDLGKAAKACAAAIFYNQGEVCVAGTRLLVEASIKDTFMAEFKQAAAAFKPMNPLDPDTIMGTLIDKNHHASVCRYISLGLEEGAQLTLDGRDQAGNFMGPTVLEQVTPHMRIANEEIFGPVLAVTTFSSEAEALHLANSSKYGLGAGVWTSNLQRAHRLARKLRVGSVFINNYNDGDMTVPFGGVKKSGNGRDKSLHAFDKFTELKTTWLALD